MMKSNPLVSYIIPSYNHSEYIDKAIESVLNQTYNPIELIVIDDCSMDNTKDVLLKYQDLPNVTIIFNEVNLRQSATVNKALALAKGDYIGILPSDDWLMPNKVELQMKKFSVADKNVGVIYGRGARFFENSDGTTETINTNIPTIKGTITKQLIEEGNFIYPITPLFRKECFNKYPFDESYTAEGEAIYLKISLGYDFDFVEDIVGVMRDHEDNTGKKTDVMFLENFRYRKEFMNRNDVPIAIKRLKGKWLGMLCKTKSMEYIISRKQFSKGRSIAQKAIFYNPIYLIDLNFFCAVILTLIPSKISNKILNNFYSKSNKY